MTDPADCGPVTLCRPQDVQAEADDDPEEFFRPRRGLVRPTPPAADQLAGAAAGGGSAKAQLVIAGGGVLYGQARDGVASIALRAGSPEVPAHNFH